MKTCIIIPAYNEEKAMGGLIRAVKKYAVDILVINDGSVDNTEKIAAENGARVISLFPNRGKGEALKSGFEYALKNEYDSVITMDADGQHSPEDVPALLKAAEASEAGIVTGNRMTNPEGMPLSRLFTNFFMSLIVSVFCRQKIPDTQCGFRLIKSPVLKRIRLISANYEIESEVLIKAAKSGFRIISVPIKSVYQGQLSLINPVLDTWRFIIMLVRIAFPRDI